MSLSNTTIQDVQKRLQGVLDQELQATITLPATLQNKLQSIAKDTQDVLENTKFDPEDAVEKLRETLFTFAEKYKTRLFKELTDIVVPEDKYTSLRSEREMNTFSAQVPTNSMSLSYLHSRLDQIEDYLASM